MYVHTMCIMLLTEAKQNITDKSGHYNRIAICKIKLAAPYRGQAEYQLCRLNTSEESRALKSCGPGIICYGLTVYSVADVCRLLDV